MGPLARAGVQVEESGPRPRRSQLIRGEGGLTWHLRGQEDEVGDGIT